MKKRIAVCLVLSWILVAVGCDHGEPGYKKQLEVKINSAPELEFSRYEDALFNLDTACFQQELMAIQKDYRPFLDGDLNDPQAVKYLKDFAVDPFSVRLYHQVKEAYPDLDEVKTIVQEVFQHFNYYYPDIQLPKKVYTCVSGVDQQIPPVLFLDDALVISLDWYLDGNEVYDAMGMPKYMSERTNTATLAKDLGNQLYKNYVQLNRKQTNLLEEMVYVGKMLFFTEAMCPSLPDPVLLGYSDVQMAWINDNEGGVWADLVGGQRLYMSDYDIFRIFFSDGPFTNEYSHEAPPRLGEYLGLQIVRSYMDHCDCNLHDLMQNTDLQEIFQDSKYKPKK